MSDEMDPEVSADLQLRAYTARTRTGLTEAQFAAKIRETATPKIIGKVPCRARCGNLADWTEEAEDAFNTFNRKLAQTADAPLDKTKIAFCASCRAKGMAAVGDSNRNHVEAMRKAIVELKDNPPSSPSDERAAVKRLEALRHPFAEECVRTICENATKKGSRRRENY